MPTAVNNTYSMAQMEFDKDVEGIHQWYNRRRAALKRHHQDFSGLVKVMQSKNQIHCKLNSVLSAGVNNTCGNRMNRPRLVVTDNIVTFSCCTYGWKLGKCFRVTATNCVYQIQGSCVPDNAAPGIDFDPNSVAPSRKLENKARMCSGC